MLTTIAVKPETLDILKHMREELKTESYDATIRKMAREMKRPKESFFGKWKDCAAKFERESLDRFD